MTALAQIASVIPDKIPQRQNPDAHRLATAWQSALKEHRKSRFQVAVTDAFIFLSSPDSLDW